MNDNYPDITYVGGERGIETLYVYLNYSYINYCEATNYAEYIDYYMTQDDINNYDVELDRALSAVYRTSLSYSAVYVDYDDCLVLEKTKVNTQLISYLYSCINRGIKIVLISRHDGNLEQALRKFRLDKLFDKVVHIKDKTPKSAFVEEKDAIFIDDSWAERNDVRTKLGLAVFSPDMVDVLM